MEKKLHDWRDGLDLTDEENEAIDYLMENYICNYCRKPVSPDIGQIEIYCPYCEMITTAIAAKNTTE